MTLRIAPDIGALLETLEAHGVEYIVVGSVAIQAWGVDVGTPGDLDVVPEASSENLFRLRQVLDALQAESWPVTGRWREVANGEFRWEDYPKNHPLYGAKIDKPDPGDITTFDSLFHMRHGELDIVPRVSGTYDDLVQRAHCLKVHGVPGVRVMSVEDLLARLTVTRRSKDATRVVGLRAVQRGEGEGQDVQNPHTRK